MSEDNQSESVPVLFGDNALAARSDAAAVARATQEIQAALVIAQRCPRDEIKAIQQIVQACHRKPLAEMAEYEYPRGGTRITGPTIVLLRAIANRWGNLRFGWKETERRNGESTVRCEAWDCQSNAQAFREFVVKHWRDTQQGGHTITDERDIYELLANMAARRVRSCLEEVIDADVVDTAIDTCRETLKKGEKTPLRDRAVAIVLAFAQFGVDKDMIERRLGNNMEAISENQLASLRRIHKSLTDGVGKREDYFKPATAAPEFGGEKSPGAQPETAGSQKPSTTQGSAVGGGSPPPPAAAADDKAEAAMGLAPEKKPEPPPPQTVGQRLVKGLRALCKTANINEGHLLDFAATIGISDGSSGSLEELAMVNAAGLQKLHDGWAEVSARIKTALANKTP